MTETRRPTIAAVTMIYNEVDFLPFWLRHYSEECGEGNCYIIDHGSTDEARGLNKNVSWIRLPRSPMDDYKRSLYVSDFCRGLLKYYDWVLYSDVDELLVARDGLVPMCQRSDGFDTVRACGLNVIMMPNEPAIDRNERVSRQRSFCKFSYSMCKPLLTRVPVTWSPGFHAASVDAIWNSNLYLMHLAPFDLQLNLKKLHKTRAMPWIDDTAGAHQRVSDFERISLLERMSAFSKIIDQTEIARFIENKMSMIPLFFNNNPIKKNSFYAILDQEHPTQHIVAIPASIAGRF